MVYMMVKRLILEPTQLKMIEPKKSNYENIFSVELINEMVLKGIPFRDAYLELKSKLSTGEIKFPKTVKHSHIGSIGNLALDKIVLKMKDNY